jgi:hypothetical protein
MCDCEQFVSYSLLAKLNAAIQERQPFSRPSAIISLAVKSLDNFVVATRHV